MIVTNAYKDNVAWTVLLTPVQGPVVRNTLTAKPTTVPANGTSTSILTLTLALPDGSPAAGHIVRFNSNRGALDTLQPATATVDEDGVATTQVFSSTTGAATITVTDTTTSESVPASTLVTFSNPSSTNPHIDGVSQSYDSQGPFFKEVPLEQTVTVQVSDWKGAPGRVEFNLNGTSKSVAATGPIVSTTYDLGSELKYSPEGTWNTLTVTAFNAAGQASLTAFRRWMGCALPDSLSSKYWIGNNGNAPDSFASVNVATRLDGTMALTLGVNWPQEPTQAAARVPAPFPMMANTVWGRTNDKFVAEVKLEVKPAPYPQTGLTGTSTFSVGLGVERKYNRIGRRPRHRVSIASLSWDVEGSVSGSFQFLPSIKLTELKLEAASDIGFRTPDLLPWMGAPALEPVLDVYGTFKVSAAGAVLYGDLPSGAFGYQDADVALKVAATLVAELDKNWGHWAELHVEAGGSFESKFQFPGNATNAANFNGVAFLRKVIGELWLSGYISVDVGFWDKEFDFGTLTGHWEYPSGSSRPSANRIAARSGGWSQPRREYQHNGRPYHQLSTKPPTHPFQLWLDKPDQQDKGGVSARGGGGWDVEETSLITNVFSSMKPDLAWKDGFATIVFPYDDPALPANQATEIHAMHQTPGGWVEKAVTDDTELDSQPQIVVTPTGQRLAVFTRTIGVNVADTPAQRLVKSEIAFSVYNEGTGMWGATSRYTNNATFEFNPQLFLGANGKLYLTWLRCPDGVFPTAFDDPILPHTDVYMSEWNGSTFVSPQRVVARADTSDRVALAVDASGVPMLVYSRDADGNKATRGDDALYFTRNSGSGWPAPARVLVETTGQTSPSATVATGGGVVLFFCRSGVSHPTQTDQKARSSRPTTR